MPLFCADLGMSTAEFGLVGSVFGGARLLSNLPLAVAAEHVGRRTFLTWGPALTAVSMVGTGLSGSLGVLLGWRVLTGLGGSAQITGAQLYLADISKPSNRARTLAPTSAAFSGTSYWRDFGAEFRRSALFLLRRRRHRRCSCHELVSLARN